MDLFTKPDFIFDSIRSYLRSKKYDVSSMHQNEKKLKENAEKIVNERLSGIKLYVFNKVLDVARSALLDESPVETSKKLVPSLVISHLEPVLL